MRPYKKPRTSEVAHGTHMSTSAKSQLLRDLKEVGIPEHVSESTARRERTRLTHAATDYGPIICNRSLPALVGDDLVLPFQHPLAMLTHTLKESESFQDLFMETIRLWNGMISIIFYGDEVTPGQALAKVNRRKVLGLYWSIAEFGFPLLSNDKLWFTAGTIQTETVNKILGGA